MVLDAVSDAVWMHANPNSIAYTRTNDNASHFLKPGSGADAVALPNRFLLIVGCTQFNDKMPHALINVRKCYVAIETQKIHCQKLYFSCLKSRYKNASPLWHMCQQKFPMAMHQPR